MNKLIVTLVFILLITNCFGQDQEYRKESINDGISKIIGYKYFKLDSFKCQSYIDSISKNEIFLTADMMPEFEGGKDKMKDFIYSNLPELWKQADIFGSEIVKFIVDKDGELSHLEIVRSIHPLFDKDILSIFEKMPNWRPGKCGNNEVPIHMTIIIKMPAYEMEIK